MEKFNFDYYKDSIKKIKCYYTYDGEVNKKTYWDGFILTRNLDGILYIEGYSRDKMDSLEKDGTRHLRYIFGDRALSHAKESLVFEVYPGKIAPIYYNMKYNCDDECFYGNWFFVNGNNHQYPNGLSGEAIIRIEDVLVDEKEKIDIIKKIATRAKKEYVEELKLFNFFTQNNIILSGENDYSSTVKKLSKYSDFIK